MKEAAKFSVDVDYAGRGTIMLDGRDISSYVRKIEIASAVGEPTTVTVTFINVDVTAVNSVARESKS